LLQLAPIASNIAKSLAFLYRGAELGSDPGKCGDKPMSKVKAAGCHGQVRDQDPPGTSGAWFAGTSRRADAHTTAALLTRRKGKLCRCWAWTRPSNAAKVLRAQGEAADPA